MTTNSHIIVIDIDTFRGSIPAGHDLVIAEAGDRRGRTAIVLYGFDEVGMFDADFQNPVYAFLAG